MRILVVILMLIAPTMAGAADTTAGWTLFFEQGIGVATAEFVEPTYVRPPDTWLQTAVYFPNASGSILSLSGGAGYTFELGATTSLSLRSAVRYSYSQLSKSIEEARLPAIDQNGDVVFVAIDRKLDLNLTRLGGDLQVLLQLGGFRFGLDAGVSSRLSGYTMKSLYARDPIVFDPGVPGYPFQDDGHRLVFFEDEGQSMNDIFPEFGVNIGYEASVGKSNISVGIALRYSPTSLYTAYEGHTLDYLFAFEFSTPL